MAEELTQAQLDQAFEYVDAKISRRYYEYDNLVSSMGSFVSTTYEPTLLKNDKSTALTGTLADAHYIKLGRMIFLWVTFTVISDPGGASIYFNIPIKAKLHTANTINGSGFTNDGTTTGTGRCVLEANEVTYMSVTLSTGSAWGAANNSFAMLCIYEAYKA